MPQPINIYAADIVAYARIEPRTVAADYRPTVKAQVHDALWMLTQQWRVGEFLGEDAGTLVKARIETQSRKLNRFKSRNGAVEAFDENVPLEAKVERLPLKADLGFRLELGNIWFKLLANHYFTDMEQLSREFRLAFPIDAVTPASGPEKNSNKPAMRVRKLVTSRSMDGYKFYEFLIGGGDVTTIPSNPSAYPLLGSMKDQFLGWIANTYYFPKTDADNSWSDRQLEYQCSVSAPLNPTPASQQHVLLADKYTRGTVDWYSFDLDADSNARLQEGAGVTIDNAAAVLAPAAFSYIPHTIEFKGMPKGRWWEFEDKNNDLSKMLTQKQDISKMVIMEFGLIYSNDWFLIPHIVPDGTVNDVLGLVTTDVFGRSFLIHRSGSSMDEQWQRWDMYNISIQGSANVTTFGQLLMVPSVKDRMESDALEKVMFLRDEMANMVWGVEDVVPDELMGGMDGKNANNELQQYLAATTPPPVDADYIPNSALYRFRISNEVPENWIPFIAKQVTPSLFYNRDVMLQRAAMLRYINGNYTDEIIRPRTDILSIGIANNQPYFINEEEVSRAGFIISENYQRTRWYDGSTFTWLGRKVQGGKGEGNSGLKFDILADKEADPGSLDIPFSGMAGWWTADNPDNQVSGGVVTLLKDHTGNGLDLGLWNSVPGPQMTTSNGVPALSFSNNLLLNQSSTKPMAGYDDFTIFYVGNSSVGRGFDDVGGSQWSIALRPDTMNIVLINPSQAQYTINTGIAPATICIMAAGLEQRDPADFPFAARMTIYNKSGNPIPTANNPYVIPGNRFLRATSSIGLTMGASAVSTAYSNGLTFETIIYRRKLSDAEIKRVMAYLSAKYPFAV